MTRRITEYYSLRSAVFLFALAFLAAPVLSPAAVQAAGGFGGHGGHSGHGGHHHGSGLSAGVGGQAGLARHQGRRFRSLSRSRRGKFLRRRGVHNRFLRKNRRFSTRGRHFKLQSAGVGGHFLTSVQRSTTHRIRGKRLKVQLRQRRFFSDDIETSPGNGVMDRNRYLSQSSNRFMSNDRY